MENVPAEAPEETADGALQRARPRPFTLADAWVADSAWQDRFLECMSMRQTADPDGPWLPCLDLAMRQAFPDLLAEIAAYLTDVLALEDEPAKREELSALARLLRIHPDLEAGLAG